MYVKLYRHRDQFVVIDDVDALYADRSGVRLLKCLCQTEEEEAVAWHSDVRSLERQGIPREFTTKSRVVIISNDWKTLNNSQCPSVSHNSQCPLGLNVPSVTLPRRRRGYVARGRIAENRGAPRQAAPARRPQLQPGRFQETLPIPLRK